MANAPQLALNGLRAPRRRESAVRPKRPAPQPPPTTANAVIEGDALRVLRALPADRRFDVIIADPPYNIGKDFGNNRDLMPLPAYVEWTQEWIAERCIDSRGADMANCSPSCIGGIR